MFRTRFSTAFAIAMLAVAVPAGAQTTAAPAPQAVPPAPQGVPPAAKPVPAVPQAVPAPRTPIAAPPVTATAGITPPADYVIGVDDALDIIYWQDKEMSAGVVVRPDGNISLPLLNDVRAAGLTPDELRAAVAKAATKFVEDPTVSVVVKAINSRKVFITGQIAKPGPYPLMDTTTVLQMLATAGGVNEYANREEITIVRREGGKEVVYRFNYKDVSRGRRMSQNIPLKPGDTIVVP